ncbi:MAG: hypothetical protein A3I72_03435 [Candidatus Tectomicrobia bacterium RIFCSPLOWO2_02_FULL_70_19]|nr:MAG: hypothetical protein A3I72_03435 [Candidatus Tectomicrobia bacterium RIFCSPLOWO2_02_FULL_70_19]
MPEIRVLSPCGVIGSGFPEGSLERGLSLKPHVIACDGGSTDNGPHSLGTGAPNFSRAATKRDLRLLLRGGRRLGIPVIVGSCGTAGGDAGLAWMRDICLEIAREDGLAFPLALVHSEQDKAYLRRRLREGCIRPLDPAPPLDEGVLDRSAHIVGMMGDEPIAKCLDGGAEVVLAGRASDTSLFACHPVRLGADRGLAWHAAKILECGAACAVSRPRPDGVFCWLRDDHFVVEPLNPGMRCSPQSVASHTLYENTDPFHITEPAGVLDTSRATYAAEDDRAVRVQGSVFRPAETYTVKLEGAELAGYQSVIIGGVRDPYILRRLDAWLDGIREGFAGRAQEILGVPDPQYRLFIRVFGRDAVMGPLEPRAGEIPHEAGLLFEVTAPAQETANALAATLAHFALHYPIPEWSGLISSLAFPFTPAEIEKGPVFRFNLNHVVVPDGPCEMFPAETLEVKP